MTWKHISASYTSFLGWVLVICNSRVNYLSTKIEGAHGP